MVMLLACASWRADYARAWCDAALACLDDAELDALGWDDAAECRRDVTHSLQGEEAPREGCVEALDALTCDEWRDGVRPEACPS